MQALISITTDGQGSSVVSARELYTFLEVKQQFADWIKKRIIKYGFQEGDDYLIVDGVSKTLDSEQGEEVFHNSMKNPGGRPQTDYALTLDMAKQLSMVENNQKGKEARQYFINAEKAARALAAAPPAPAAIAPAATEQMMLQLMQQQAQLMAGQQTMLEQLRAEVEIIRHTGHRPPSRAKRLPAPVAPPHLNSGPALSLRQQVNRKVNDYCAYHSAQQTEAYNYLYKRMMEVYGVNVYRLIRVGRESILDAIERYGHLDRLYSLVMAELSYSDD